VKGDAIPGWTSGKTTTLATPWRCRVRPIGVGPLPRPVVNRFSIKKAAFAWVPHGVTGELHHRGTRGSRARISLNRPRADSRTILHPGPRPAPFSRERGDIARGDIWLSTTGPRVKRIFVGQT